MGDIVKVLGLCICISIASLSEAKTFVPEFSIPKNSKKQHAKNTPLITGLRDKDLQKFCNEWYGTKYKFGGCTKSGIDCSCFAKTVYKSVYDKDLSRSSKSQYLDCKSIKKWKKLQEGDLVFFKIDGLKVDHVGIYLKDGKFIHSSTKRGVILNDLNEDYYKKHYYRGGKVK